jgi:hypothetical protein
VKFGLEKDIADYLDRSCEKQNILKGQERTQAFRLKQNEEILNGLVTPTAGIAF